MPVECTSACMKHIESVPLEVLFDAEPSVLLGNGLTMHEHRREMLLNSLADVTLGLLDGLSV